MPLFDYRCGKGHVTEELFRSGEAIPVVIECGWCGCEARKVVPLIAYTPLSYGDSRAYFDRGLGCEVRNRQHREKIMKERNLFAYEDMPNSAIHDAINADEAAGREHDRFMSKYNSNLKEFDGDKARALDASVDYDKFLNP